MNDKTSFERYVIEAFDREGTGRPVPDAIHDELITRASRQRQRPVWLAYVKEPPMRLTNSLAVGSPTVRVLATMLATLLLILAMAVAGIAGKSLLAADDTLVVDPEGQGQYATIGEAVAAAEDGNTVLLMAGTYPESVVVDKPITIRGEEGATVEVAVGCTVDDVNFETTCPPAVPMHPEHGAYGFLLDGVDATISDVHFDFGAVANAVIVSGGSASLEGLSATTPPGQGLVLNFVDGSRVSLTDSDLSQAWLLPSEDSHVAIDNSDFTALFVNNVTDSEPSTVRGSRISGQIYFTGPMIIERNEFIGRAEFWETDSQIIADGSDGWIIRDNVLSGSRGTSGAIDVTAYAGSGTVEGNVISDSRVGIVLASRGEVEAVGNTVSGGGSGFMVNAGAPDLVGNTVEGASDWGVLLTQTEARLSGNRLCGNDTDLYIANGAEPIVDDDNEICVLVQPE